MPSPSLPESTPQGASLPLSADEFAALESMLHALRQRLKVAPRWEFCEGFLAALVCCRRQIEPHEYLPLLLCPEGAPLPLAAIFESQASQDAFLALWTRRWNAVVQALDTPVTALDDPAAYQPEVLDARAADAAPLQPPGGAHAALPSFGQLWAQGFMAAVNAWPEEWSGPRNKAAQHWRSATLGLLQALTLDDRDPPTLAGFADAAGPPSVSAPRMAAFADAIWAVYSLRATWRKLGPRVTTVRVVAAPGRNEPCHCGSGKKFKKCCDLPGP
jgi:uncharacterized protein